MEMLAELVRNVAVLVLLTMFLQMLLPEGQMAGFIRMIMGILLLSAVLSPLLDFMGQEHSAPVYSRINYEESTEEILWQGQALAADYVEQAAGEYSDGLARQMNAITGLIPGMVQAEAEISLDGAGRVIWVYIEGMVDTELAGLEDTEKKLTETIGDFFSLSEEIIELNLKAAPAEEGGGMP